MLAIFASDKRNNMNINPKKSKIMKRIIQTAVIALVCLVTFQVSVFADNDKPISVTQLPATAQQTIKKYLPNEGKIFTDDTFTNISTSFYVSEIVREKILRLTKEEVPHSVTCYLEKMDQDKDKVHLQVLIVVDRDNLKKILIGKNGSLIKKVGIEARRDLEEYFQKRVYLETYVKTIENWRDRQKYLKELGLDELDS